MIRIAVVGDIGSGKSFISNLFKQPVFNADLEVADIYKKDKSCFAKIKKKISNIVNTIVRKRLNYFLKKNKNKKIVILDIPLYFENKLSKKGDIVVYIEAKKKQIFNQLKKRNNFNLSFVN